MFIAKPLLKWVGGKAQIIDKIIDVFPKEIKGNYYEPFLGGGSVMLAFLSHVKHGTIRFDGMVYASDVNASLVSVYKNVQKNGEEVINELQKLMELHGNCAVDANATINRKATNIDDALTSPESFYYRIRSQYNKMPKEDKCSPQGSAYFMFLNKTCFRGLYREGPNGFNVPYGNYKNPTIFTREHVLAISVLIQNVVFRTAPFSETIANTEHGDFVYLDPPYAPVNEASFVTYTKEGFDGTAHKLLFKACDEMLARNVCFVMSNADVPMVQEHFNNTNVNIQVISCKRSINSKKPESRENEVLIPTHCWCTR